jgi:hypothetical protein
VSAVHTGDGALVIEVGDEGLGMTEADLRVANTRLQSGGEVNPYTARHMGLFVIGRLADTHGLVVRLRSTVAGDPSSGITAGIYVPQNLLVAVGAARFTDFVPAPPTAVPPPVLDRPVEPAVNLVQPALNSDSLLPQRDPGASGIAGGPAGEPQQPRPLDRQADKPADTSAFFAARAQVRDDPQPRSEPVTGSDDAIYQKMLSEWLVDPTDLGSSTDLDWKSVWDNGWSAAAAAEDTPVAEHTPDGLPVRQPGARLVPGAGGDPLASEPAGDEFDTGPLPDPAAVRASISSHFGGVHAGRTHARETGGSQ